MKTPDDDMSIRAFVRQYLGVEGLRGEIVSSRSSQINRLDNLERSITQLKGEIMATFREVLEAIQTNAIGASGLLTQIGSTQTRILEILEKAQSGTVSPQELAEALSTLTQSNTQIGQAKDAIAQLVPTIESPEAPSEPTEPLPPVSQPVPETPEDIVIVPAPGVGPDGSVAIDLV